jgi:hypothetical protein
VVGSNGISIDAFRWIDDNERRKLGVIIMSMKQKIAIITLITILLSSNLVLILSQPFDHVMIVTFGNTGEERIALETLQSEIPDALVVSYGSLEYALMKTRCIGPVVFVGHGTENGILYGNALVKSSDIALDIENSLASHVYLLACGSDAIAKIEQSGRVTGFGPIVEAEVGALCISILITMKAGLLTSFSDPINRLFNLINDKISGVIPIFPLRIIGEDPPPSTPPPVSTMYFSDAEIWSAWYILALSLFWTAVGVGASVAIGKLTSSLTTTASRLSGPIWDLIKQFFGTLGRYGAASASTAVNAAFGGLPQLFSYIGDITSGTLSLWISKMDIVEWSLFLLIVGMEMIVIILTAGCEWYVRLAVGWIFSIMNVALIAVKDSSDPDGIPCSSLLEAFSEWIS